MPQAKVTRGSCEEENVGDVEATILTITIMRQANVQRMTNNCTCFLSSSLIILGQYLTDCTQKYSFSKGFTFYGETNKQERRTKTQSTVVKQHIHATTQNYSYSMFVDVFDRYQFPDDAVEVSIWTTTPTVPNC